MIQFAIAIPPMSKMTKRRSWETNDRLRSQATGIFVLWSDGGGKARAARHPLFGATRGSHPKPRGHRSQDRPGQWRNPAVIGVLDGEVIKAASFEIAAGVVVAVHAGLNPDKLAHLTQMLDA